MTSVEALLQARKELEAAYQRDIEAIDYLLTRLGHNAGASVNTDDSAEQGRAPQKRRVRGTAGTTKPRSLRDWTERAFSAHSGEPLSAPAVYEWAMANGGSFQAERQQTLAGLGHVLRQMAVEGRVMIALQGSGRKPNTYEWVGELPYQVGEPPDNLNLSAA